MVRVEPGSEGWSMTILAVWRKRLGLALLATAVLAPAWFFPARAQQPRAGANNNAGNAPPLVREPAALPPPPPQCAWGEVIMANPKWMVVQNHQGQQFPISMDAVNQFLIRWPTTLTALTPDSSVIEAIGPDFGSNTMQTDHVDVFEGADRNLVTPTLTTLLPNNRMVTTIDPGFNRFMNGFDIGSQNLLYGWAYPLDPGNLGVPARLHVVGNALSINPLQVRVPGNNFATVLPAEPGGMTVTQMTRGNSTFAEKGDLVFLMPTELTSRTVVLSQLVLYKKIPLRQFRLP
jgi:hypothetical protein